MDHQTDVRSCGLGWSFGLQPYGQEWRDGRRAFHHDFNINAVRKYRQVHVQEAHLLIRSILATPEKFMVHVQRYVAAHAGLV